jgi:hypothetical protein
MNLSQLSVKLAKVSTACLLSTQAFGFVGTEEPAGVEFKTSTMRPQTYRGTQSFYSTNAPTSEYDKHTNALRYISGKNLLGVNVTEPSSSAFENAALKAIATNKQTFGVDASDVRLNKKATLVSGPDASVTFHVLRNGIRINDASIAFHFKNGSLILVRNESYSEAIVEDSLQSDTSTIAASAVGGMISKSKGSSFRVKATDAGYSLVKVDEFVVANGAEAFVVQVNTVDGSIFELRTKNFHLRGQATAKVYPRYYGDSVKSAPLGFIKLDNITGAVNALGEFSSTDDSTAPLLKGFIGKHVSVHNEPGDDYHATATKVGNKWSLEANIATTSNALSN